MGDFNCDLFELIFRLSAEDFRKEDFLKAAGVENESELVDEDGDLSLTVSFGSRKQSAKQHAHLRILIRADGSGRATLNYHQAPRAVVGKQPPYLEDSAQWFAQFFNSDTPEADFNIVFMFGKEFVPTINLPYPLLAADKTLKDSVVTGVSIDFPDNAPLESVIVDHHGDSTVVFAQTYSEVELKKFDLFQEIERFSRHISPLIRRKEGRNDSESATGVKE